MLTQSYDLARRCTEVASYGLARIERVAGLQRARLGWQGSDLVASRDEYLTPVSRGCFLQRVQRPMD